MGTHPIFESDFDCLTDKCRDMSSFNEIVTNFLRQTLNKKVFVASDCLKFIANKQHVSYVPRNMAKYLASQYPKILTRVFASFQFLLKIK